MCQGVPFGGTSTFKNLTGEEKPTKATEKV
jgi:hypothetical protein